MKNCSKKIKILRITPCLIMKANFKINKKNDFYEITPPDLLENNKQNQTQFEEYLKTLPTGWNLWSIRNSSNKS